MVTRTTRIGPLSALSPATLPLPLVVSRRRPHLGDDAVAIDVDAERDLEILDALGERLGAARSRGIAVEHHGRNTSVVPIENVECWRESPASQRIAARRQLDRAALRRERQRGPLTAVIFTR